MKLLSIGAAVGILLAQAGYANSAPSPEEYLASAKALEQMVLEARQHQTMPRLSDSRVSAALKTLSDERIISAGKYGAQDLEFLVGICGAANRANMSYLLFGIADQVVGIQDPVVLAARTKVLMEKNAKEFQDEIFLLLPFMVRCFSAQVPLMNKLIETMPPEEFTDIRRGGVLQLRSGLLNIFYGSLTSAADAGFNETNRLRLLTALADTSSIFASSLPKDYRDIIAALAHTTLPTAPPALQKPLLQIQNSMGTPDCTALCKL